MTPHQAQCEHHFVVVYRRPWRRRFRKLMILRCWECALRIEEP